MVYPVDDFTLGLPDAAVWTPHGIQTDDRTQDGTGLHFTTATEVGDGYYRDVPVSSAPWSFTLDADNVVGVGPPYVYHGLFIGKLDGLAAGNSIGLCWYYPNRALWFGLDNISWAQTSGGYLDGAPVALPTGKLRIRYAGAVAVGGSGDTSGGIYFGRQANGVWIETYQFNAGDLAGSNHALYPKVGFGISAIFSAATAWTVRSAEASWTAPPPPPLPSVVDNLNETHDWESIHVFWDANDPSEDIINYFVQVDSDPAIDVGNVPEWDITGLDNATSYFVKVWAVNATGAGSWTALTIVTSDGWPEVPENLEAPNPGHDSITITWDPPPTYEGPPVETYDVWYINQDDPSDDGTFILDVGLIYEYTIEGLTPGTHYNVQVSARNYVDNSWWAVLDVVTDLVYDQVVWGDPGERYYHTGVDRGVLYLSDRSVAWNGITGVDEAGQGPATVLYRDGVIYHADVDPSDYSGSLTAFFWPDAFSKCLGIPEVAPGFHIDNQRPTPFGLSYRSLIGSGTQGDRFGYQIHLVYNAVASIGTRSRKTLNETPNLTEFTFDLVAKPVKIPGFRPSSHFIIDTRNIDPGALETLEAILYGDGVSQPRLPLPADLYDILSFGSAITFVDHGDGTWTATGSSQNLIDNGDGTIQILNVNGTDNGDGTYILEDTP